MLAGGFDGVVFDCDGVLVDSEPITSRVLMTMLNELGLPIDLKTTHRQFVGRSLKEDLATIERLTGRALAPDWLAQYIARRDAALSLEVVAVNGVASLLASLQVAGVPFAVASGAERAKMRLTLGKTGLAHWIGERFYGADQVAHAKPAPDVYLLAMRETGIDPLRTLVIEDTPTGTRAGVAAGATVLGYCERADPRALLDAGASAVFGSMGELLRLLGVGGGAARRADA